MKSFLLVLLVLFSSLGSGCGPRVYVTRLDRGSFASGPIYGAGEDRVQSHGYRMLDQCLPIVVPMLCSREPISRISCIVRLRTEFWHTSPLRRQDFLLTHGCPVSVVGR